MPTLTLEQYQYADDGVLLNSDTALPFVDIESVEGLDSPDFRTQTNDREGVDGGYADARWETMRTVTLSGTVYTDPLATQTFIDSLKANFAPTVTPKPLYFQTDAGQRMLLGKSLGFKYTKDANRRLGITPFQVQIICEDPRIYTPGAISTTATLSFASTTGRSYPLAFPISYGAVITTNTAGFVLGGNRPTPGVLRIDGPVVNPAITYQNTGSVLKFNTTINTGEYLLIDLAAKSVLLNGTTGRRSTLTITGGWFFLQPGTNTFVFSGVQTPPTPLAVLTVTAYSAWR